MTTDWTRRPLLSLNRFALILLVESLVPEAGVVSNEGAAQADDTNPYTKMVASIQSTPLFLFRIRVKQ